MTKLNWSTTNIWNICYFLRKYLKRKLQEGERE